MNKDFERRSFETSVDKESNEVLGYASLFNSESRTLRGYSEDFGWVEFREIIRPGAFEGRLNDDVKALYNHDYNQLLARSTSGTLKLSVDEKGLQYRFDLPNTTLGNDIRELMKRGDISESSFGFNVEDDEWVNTPEGIVRYINKVGALDDVSVVTEPAYKGTKVSLRSYSLEENVEKEEKKSDLDLRNSVREEYIKRKIKILSL